MAATYLYHSKKKTEKAKRIQKNKAEEKEEV